MSGDGDDDSEEWGRDRHAGERDPANPAGHGDGRGRQPGQAGAPNHPPPRNEGTKPTNDGPTPNHRRGRNRHPKGGPRRAQSPPRRGGQARGNAGPVTRPCPGCGAQVPVSAHYCTACGTVTGSKKSPAVAVILSLLVAGAGQLYNGQAARGVVAFVGSMVWGLVLLSALAPSIFLTGGSVLVLYLLLFVGPIAAAVDAYLQAGKINRGEVVP